MGKKWRRKIWKKLVLTELVNSIEVTYSRTLRRFAVSNKQNLPDFSDIVHLTIAFQGISLSSEQMTLVKNALKCWSEKTKSTPGEMAHLYIRKKYPNMRQEFEKHQKLSEFYQSTINKIIDMAVEIIGSLDDSLGPLLVSYAEGSGILTGRDCFDQYYWQKVFEALCTLPHQFPRLKRQEVTLNWRIIILFLCYKIEYAVQLQNQYAYNRYSFDNPCFC
ncbi:unnamed protein product [Thelazia callipaeda]|uniref:Globin family profile domain-containing protein n=1 Tax=Thelazia callipaeda TaxID=103827 RepID=A0A158RCQ1_THECL|nr:unnamed protein product [Thelazia callipaeda]